MVFRRLIEIGCGGVSGAALCFTTAVATVDVLGRYLFRAPLPGASDLIGMGMLVTVFFAVPLVCLRDQHIRVELFEAAIARRPLLRRLLRHAQTLAVIALLVLTAWCLWQVGDVFARYGDTASVLKFALAPFAYAIAIALLIAVPAQILAAFGTRKE